VEQAGDQLIANNQTTTYQWYDCDSSLPIPGAIHRTFTPAQSGRYQVRLTTTQGCEAFSDCFDVEIVSTNNGVENSFIISPNPAKDYIQIRFNNESPIRYRVELLDIVGNAILKSFETNQTGYVLDVSTFPNGIYLIKMTDQSGYSSSTMFLKI
ncbi:MAG TPA: T9SS type A sorting domain-containing protein, partial [Saprospiraceae bacterium]|nr:T9SS type A sorting domain-containing protein [Saprospiraceae bacterium]